MHDNINGVCPASFFRFTSAPRRIASSTTISITLSLPEPLRTNFAAGIRDRIMTIDEYLELVERIQDGLRKEIDEGWVEVQLHPNGGQWCSDEALLRMKEYALAHGMYIHLHLLETQYQAEYARRTWGKSFIQHYQDIGFLGPWVSFAHAVWLDEEDLQLIAASGAHLVTNPSSNLRLRSGAFNMRRACELGLATVLTSGQAADAWTGRALLAPFGLATPTSSASAWKASPAPTPTRALTPWPCWCSGAPAPACA